MMKKRHLFLTTLGLIGTLVSGKSAKAQEALPDTLVEKEQVVTTHGVEYSAFGKGGRVPSDLPSGQHTWAVHMEVPSIRVDPIRHAEAAADILNKTADGASGYDIPVDLIGSNILQPDSLTQATVAQADVVSVSQEADLRACLKSFLRIFCFKRFFWRSHVYTLSERHYALSI